MLLYYVLQNYSMLFLSDNTLVPKIINQQYYKLQKMERDFLKSLPIPLHKLQLNKNIPTIFTFIFNIQKYQFKLPNCQLLKSCWSIFLVCTRLWLLLIEQYWFMTITVFRHVLPCSLGDNIPALQSNLLPPAPSSTEDDRGCRFPWNISTHLTNYMVSHAMRL